jgi:hypothetical protein
MFLNLSFGQVGEKIKAKDDNTIFDLFTNVAGDTKLKFLK